MATTKKDIYLAAHKSAVNLLGTTSDFELTTKKLEEFNLANLDPIDYDVFDIYFNDRFQVLTALTAMPSPSAMAAAATAAANAKAATLAAKVAAANPAPIPAPQVS
jgi:hypothetical protein